MEYPKVIDAAVAKGDTALLKGTWTYTIDPKNNPAIFTIGTTNYTTKDFFEYVKNKQRSRKGSVPAQIMRNFYKDFSEETLISYEESHLESKYIDYKMLVKEYRDGILLFQLMDEKVWTKAINDTSGLKNFFNQNKNNYKWDTRAHAVIYNLANKEKLEQLKSELGKGRYKTTDPEVNINFEPKKTVLTIEGEDKVNIALNKLIQDKDLILEISAGADSKEAAPTSFQRAEGILSYLITKGVPSSRIVVVDRGKAVPRKTEKERSADRALLLNFYTLSKKAIEARFNEKAPLTLSIAEGVFQKEENEILKKANWTEGTQVLEDNGRVYYINISKIDQPRLKTFEESRGLAISDYQSYLEKEWVKSLKVKYPVAINQLEFQKLIQKKN